jgi:hypothetical protein
MTGAPQHQPSEDRDRAFGQFQYPTPPLGTYDSGFPDEHAFEDWLLRLDNMVDNHRRLTSGEHVSGPAADQYRHRVSAAHQKFAGRVLANHNQARDLVTNPPCWTTESGASVVASLRVG